MKLFSNPNAKLKSRHGQYQIAVLGNIVAVSAAGTASREAIERYNKDMMEVVSQFQEKKWAFLGYLHGPAILTRQAELELQKSIEWRAERGMAIGALITGDTTIEAMVQEQFERIYKKTDIRLGMFSDEESAIIWLEGQGFSAEVI
ncbi:hypothetical protein [Planctobacterium marinum]|uniref:Uncharacterized protein n=1 Tax=Planctobacterium marinum TaxID=1631968 RepID=A0AA48I920_9ALTE|nr:hypothetical protein MACH26_37110 [Planctobacterium marinum]